jgi:uncharacterized membrane protein YgcG
MIYWLVAAAIAAYGWSQAKKAETAAKPAPLFLGPPTPAPAPSDPNPLNTVLPLTGGSGTIPTALPVSFGHSPLPPQFAPPAPTPKPVPTPEPVQFAPDGFWESPPEGKSDLGTFVLTAPKLIPVPWSPVGGGGTFGGPGGGGSGGGGGTGGGGGGAGRLK